MVSENFVLLCTYIRATHISYDMYYFVDVHDPFRMICNELQFVLNVMNLQNVQYIMNLQKILYVTNLQNV
jgi:hypothetical protein